MNLRNVVSSILGSSGSTKPESGSGNNSIASRLAAKRAPALLNLGCGTRWHPDWLNLDFQPQDASVFRHDLRQPLPLPDASCAAVYHSHVLEHFSRPAARRFLLECRRVLAPGGVLRVAVPDLETIARLYLRSLDEALAGDTEAGGRHEWMTLELLDQLVREQTGGEVMKYWRRSPMPAEDFVIARVGEEARRFLEAFRSGRHGPPVPEPENPPEPTEASVAGFRALGEVHKWMYDRVSLRALLESVGFNDVKVCGAAESSIPGFNRYGLDTNPDGLTRKPDSLFMEARKPAAGNTTAFQPGSGSGSSCG